jgi:hypothetical protein
MVIDENPWSDFPIHRTAQAATHAVRVPALHSLPNVPAPEEKLP